MECSSRIQTAEDPDKTGGRPLVGVANGFDAPGACAWSDDDALHRYAALIGRLGGVPTQPVRLERRPGLRYVVSPDRLRADIAALVLIHPPSTWPADGQVTTPVPTVTDHDALAITLTAAVLTVLSRDRRPTVEGRVLIVEGRKLPQLAPLLVAAEAGEVTIWNTSDEARFSLSTLVADADVVVDLLDRIPTPDEDSDTPVIAPDWANDPLLVLPGLARALSTVPFPAFDSADLFGDYYDVCHACALALVMATPPDQLAPRAPSCELSSQIAAAATGELGAKRKHRRRK